MKIDRCAGGEEAVELACENQYDMILMDHMMPGMDGMEATAKIREWEDKSKDDPEHPKGVPIIALTANAVSGMREMYLEKGFNDFISKPIDIAKLDELMDKWILREKRIIREGKIEREVFSGDVGFYIPGIDVVRGINMTGGTEAGYKQVLGSFYKDAEERLKWFEILRFPQGELDLHAFTSQVHALKSAAGTIGAAALSMEAAQLEEAGKKEDLAYISQGLPVFFEHLKKTAADIHQSLSQADSETGGADQKHLDLSDPVLQNILSLLKDAIDQKNMKEIDRTLEELEKFPLNSGVRESVMLISDKVLMSEYPEAFSLINKLLGAGE
jgi:CheY-like chemotaxis protein